MFQSISKYIPLYITFKSTQSTFMSAILNNNGLPLSANIKWGLIIDIIPTTHDILLFANTVEGALSHLY